MSVVHDAVAAIRGALLLADRVEQIGHELVKVSALLTDHDKRLIRLETRWETAVELSALAHGRGRLGA